MDKVRLLLKHKNTQRVQFVSHVDYKCGFRVDQRHYMKGITDVLQRAYPFSCGRNKYGLKGNIESAAQQCQRMSGIDHGKVVDKEITALINEAKLDFDKFAAAHKNYDPCTRRIFNWLLAKGWVPVRSQLPIWSSTSHFATAIDILCVKDSQLILVELKVTKHDEAGFDQYAKQDFGSFMSAPFQELPRTQLNHHLMQLLASYACLVRNYGLKPDRSVVLRVGATDIRSYDLPKTMTTRSVLTSFLRRLGLFALRNGNSRTGNYRRGRGRRYRAL